MSAFLETARDFLAHRRLAVAGLSHDRPNAGNLIYRKLRAAGYEMYAVNPAAATVEGDRCYGSVAELPTDVEGVIITTHPDVSPRVIEECAQCGVKRVWLHRSVGAGSVSDAAVALCAEHGIAVLDGGCPMMVLEPDLGHRCMRWLLDARHRLPDGSRYLQPS